MKELLEQALTAPLSGVRVKLSLTKQAQEGYSKGIPRFSRGGDILMATEGQLDMDPNSQANLEQSEISAQAPDMVEEQLTERIEQIQNPELKKFAGDFKDKVSTKPLSKWDDETLRSAYLGWIDNVSGLENQTEGSTGDKEKIPSDAQPFINLIIGEMRRRNIDMKPLFEEAAKRAEKKGQPLRSIGAADSEATKEQEEERRELERIRAEREKIIKNAIAAIDTDITDSALLNQIKALRSYLDAGLSKGQALEKVLRDSLGKVGQLEINYGSEQEREKRDQQREKLRKRLEVLTKQVISGILEDRNREEMIERHEGIYGERKLTVEQKNLIRTAETPEEMEDLQKLFNRMFDNVDSLPLVEFSAGLGSIGEMEYMEFLKVLNEEITACKDKDPQREKELLNRRTQFTNEKSARTIIHNAYYAVTSGQDTKQMSEYTAGFPSGWLDLSFGKTGVVKAMHFYEQAMKLVKAAHGGYLPAKEVIGHLEEGTPGEVNILAEKLLTDANLKGQLVVDEKGNPKKDEDGVFKKLSKWELDRALSLSRGLSVIIGNSIEISATSILPGMESKDSMFNDIFAQKIVGQLYPRHSGLKFKLEKTKYSRILAYILDSKRSPWSPKEIKNFDKMDFKDKLKVFNDLMPEGQERALSILNIFDIGGMLSRTGWRYAGNPAYPGESAVKKMLNDPNEKEWIGTGMTIEKYRNDLKNLKSKNKKEKRDAYLAKAKILKALEKTTQFTPLRFLLGMREFQEQVLTDILKDSSYFGGDTKDEERGIAIIREIDKRIADKEKTRKEVAKDDSDLLQLFNGKYRAEPETDQKKNDKEEIRKKDQKMQITKEVLMGDNDLGIGKEIQQLILIQDDALSRKDGNMVRESRLGKFLQDKFLYGKYDDSLDVKAGKNETFIQLFLRRLEDKGWKTPFIFGTEDIPFDKYVFEETGGRSVARRWADMASGAEAGEIFGKFLEKVATFKDQKSIVDVMEQMYEKIDFYNEDYAKQFMMELGEGIMKFYGKGWINRFPIVGSVMNMISDSSYAQIAYGKEAMAWDEIEQNEFTRLLRDRGLIKIDQQHSLQKEAGGSRAAVVGSYTRTVLPLMMMAIAFFILTNSFKEERS